MPPPSGPSGHAGGKTQRDPPRGGGTPSKTTKERGSNSTALPRFKLKAIMLLIWGINTNTTSTAKHIELSTSGAGSHPITWAGSLTKTNFNQNNRRNQRHTARINEDQHTQDAATVSTPDGKHRRKGGDDDTIEPTTQESMETTDTDGKV